MNSLPDLHSCFKTDRKSTRLNSSHVRISYAVFCLKKKNTSNPTRIHISDTSWDEAPPTGRSTQDLIRPQPTLPRHKAYQFFLTSIPPATDRHVSKHHGLFIVNTESCEVSAIMRSTEELICSVPSLTGIESFRFVGCRMVFISEQVCWYHLYLLLFFFNDTATTEIYTLSLHDALPIFRDGKKLKFTIWNLIATAPWCLQGAPDIPTGQVHTPKSLFTI